MSQMDPQTIVERINANTKRLEAAQGPVDWINLRNAALAVSGTGPVIAVAAKIHECAHNIMASIKVVGDQPHTEKEDNQKILEAVKGFTAAQKSLMASLVKKADEVKPLLPLMGAPVLSALQDLEVATHTIAHTVSALLPHTGDGTMNERSGVADPLAGAVKVWADGVKA